MQKKKKLEDDGGEGVGATDGATVGFGVGFGVGLGVGFGVGSGVGNGALQPYSVDVGRVMLNGVISMSGGGGVAVLMLRND